MNRLITELDRRIAAYHRMIQILGKRNQDSKTRQHLQDTMMLDMSLRELLRGGDHEQARH